MLGFNSEGRDPLGHDGVLTTNTYRQFRVFVAFGAYTFAGIQSSVQVSVRTLRRWIKVPPRLTRLRKVPPRLRD